MKDRLLLLLVVVLVSLETLKDTFEKGRLLCLVNRVWQLGCVGSFKLRRVAATLIVRRCRVGVF